MIMLKFSAALLSANVDTSYDLFTICYSSPLYLIGSCCTGTQQ